MIYFMFEFEITNTEQCEQVVALLSEQGFEGFEENDFILKAFVAENEFDEEAFQAFKNLFPQLKFSKKDIENINWNQQWEQSFEPVTVDGFAAIRASFHEAVLNVKHEIIITPKMSFGTGHHATTFLMIQQMELINLTGKTVLDFGTGTGVLAILADKAGAAQVLAIDNDEWSITNTKENLVANQSNNIVVEQHSSINCVEKFDVVLANINLNVISDNLAKIEGITKKETIILLSGFLKSDELKITEVLDLHNFKINKVTQKGEWICLNAGKK